MFLQRPIMVDLWGNYGGSRGPTNTRRKTLDGGSFPPSPPSPTPLYHNFIFRIMRDQKQYVEKVILCTPPPYPICAHPHPTLFVHTPTLPYLCTPPPYPICAHPPPYPIYAHPHPTLFVHTPTLPYLCTPPPYPICALSLIRCKCQMNK